MAQKSPLTLFDFHKQFRDEEDCKDNVTEHEVFPIVSGEEPLPWVHTIISNAKAFVLGTYHGIGPKHLQVYLDEFCYRFNRRFWEDQLFNRMLAACMNCETITFGELTQ